MLTSINEKKRSFAYTFRLDNETISRLMFSPPYHPRVTGLQPATTFAGKYLDHGLAYPVRNTLFENVFYSINLIFPSMF